MYTRTAAVLYEYVLTLPQEVKQYWGREIKLPSALFFANRYLCLVDRLIVLSVIFAEPSTEVNL